MQLFTDGWFLQGMDLYLQERLSQANAAPTYVYLFTHHGAASFTEIFQGGRENFYGKEIVKYNEFSLLTMIFNYYQGLHMPKNFSIYFQLAKNYLSARCHQKLIHRFAKQ